MYGMAAGALIAARPETKNTYGMAANAPIATKHETKSIAGKAANAPAVANSMTLLTSTSASLNALYAEKWQ